ncbi:MAG TPA: amidohydrolase family protein [Candidatus Acidoferrum sp.]|nr:amidohydrolase family protein [Candidatus Acidoferrum sp.]
MMKRRTLLAASAAGLAASMSGSLFAADARPFKLFDTHAHFYTNQPDKYPFNASGARKGAERTIAKAMARPMTPKVVFQFWDEIGVEMGTGVQYNSTYNTDNSYLLDIAKAHPDRIIPVVILSPTDAATPTTLQKMVKENRIAAVRFSGTPNERGEVAFASDAASDTWAAANELGLTIVLMSLGANIPASLTKIANFAERHPNVKVAMDHIGYPHPELLPASFGLSPEHLALAAHKNVHYKFTSLLISEMEDNAKAANKPMVELKPFIEHMVSVFGIDHLMWGSDHGNVEVDDVAYAKRALMAASGLTQAQQQAFFHDNGKALFVPGGRGRAKA